MSDEENGREDVAAMARTVRELLRQQHRAALATLSVDDAGAPYASLVMLATDVDLAPLLLLSGLAEHTRNIAADPRVSLLVDGTGGLRVPLAGARATLMGRARRDGDERSLARYLRYHPDAEQYAGFADFALYRVDIHRAHLVSGFGRIAWIEADALLPDPRACRSLAEAEPAILTHLNEQHRDSLQLYAKRLSGSSGGDWRAVGVDPEGLDMAADGRFLRLPFSQEALSPDAVRRELVLLAQRARNAGPEATGGNPVRESRRG